MLFCWDAPLFFANAEFFKERALDVVAKAPTPVRWCVVAAEPVTSVDVTTADALLELNESLRAMGAKLALPSSEKEVEHFLNVDFVNHVALVVVAHENSKQTIVGAARYFLVELGTADVAFGIVDEFQGQGIGAALIRNLASIARQAGLNKLIAEKNPAR